jgi:hypothetical protein
VVSASKTDVDGSKSETREVPSSWDGAKSDAKLLEVLITDLYEKVDNEPVPPGSFSAPGWFPGAAKPTGYAHVFEKLAEARTALKAGEESKAERFYHEAYGLFRWYKKTSGWAESPVALLGLPRWMALILYEMVWLTAAVAIAHGVFGGSTSMTLLGVPVTYLAWGTIGGVTWAIFGVWLHTIRGDFDPTYLPWYFTKPLLGGVAGALVFLLADIIRNEAPQADENVLYFAAFVLGFFEALLVNVLETLRERITATVKTLLGSQPSATTT